MVKQRKVHLIRSQRGKTHLSFCNREILKLKLDYTMLTKFASCEVCKQQLKQYLYEQGVGYAESAKLLVKGPNYHPRFRKDLLC